jgi:hypothetical protein
VVNSNSCGLFSIYILRIVAIREVLVHLHYVFLPYTCGYLGGAAFEALGRAVCEGQEGREQLHDTATLDIFTNIETIPLHLRI